MVAEPHRIPQIAYFGDPRAQVAVHREVQQGPIPAHRHEFMELVVILNGTGMHVTENHTQPISGGDVLVINRSRSHAYEETQHLSLVNVLMREDALLEAQQEYAQLPGFHALFTLEPVRWKQREFSSRMRLSSESLRRIQQWVDALEEETQRPGHGGRLMAKSWLMLIIGELSRLYGAHAETSPHLEMRLSRVLSWIEENYTRQIDLPVLAKVASMSERGFLRHFREATGKSPIAYVNELRTRRARELLETDDTITIAEAAARTGFHDSNYFSRVFRKIHGCPPRNCRSQ